MFLMWKAQKSDILNKNLNYIVRVDLLSNYM